MILLYVFFSVKGKVKKIAPVRFIRSQRRFPFQNPKLSVFSFPLSTYLVGLKLTVLIMSPKTPAAVTPAPAPYPRTVRGIGV